MWRLLTPNQKVRAMKILKKMQRVRKFLKKKLDDELLKRFFLCEFNINIHPSDSIGIWRPTGRRVLRKTKTGGLQWFSEVEVFMVERDGVIYETTKLLMSEDGELYPDPLYWGSWEV